jgi:flagellar motor switch protein FliN/FliY
LASDLSNIIRDDICNTLESLLATSVSISSTSKVVLSDMEGECMVVDITFTFSNLGDSQWKFLIPTVTATKFEYLMLGGISDEKTSIDDEVVDAVNEIVSNICGSVSTNINAQEFEDIGSSKFTNNGKDIVSCDSSANIDNTYKFMLSLSDVQLPIFVEFDQNITIHLAGLTGDIPVFDQVEEEHTTMHPILSMLGEDSIDNLQLLFDVKFKLSVRLGTKVILLKDVLTLDTGTII